MSRKKVLILDPDRDKSPGLTEALREMGYPNVEFLEIGDFSEIPPGFIPILTIIDLDHLDHDLVQQIPEHLINNGSKCFGITTTRDGNKNGLVERIGRKISICKDTGELCYSSDRILGSFNNNYKRIGIIGIGKIGEALLTQLVERKENLGIEEIVLYYREESEREKERVNGIVKQLATLDIKLPIHTTGSLNELGKNSGVIVITIGRREGGTKKREDLTGQYFRDIKEIMEGIGNSESTIFMATNPITPNCLVANIYSKRQNPNIIGFTRLDYIRAKHILKGWLEEVKLENMNVELDVLGPHGYGLLITNIRIGKEPEKNNPIHSNQGFGLFFENVEGRIEKLSYETAQYGEDIYRSTSPETTPFFYALQIIESLNRMLKEGERDISAIDVNLSEICRSRLKFPRKPTYMSFPVIYHNGIPHINPNFNIENIPETYRKSLLSTLRGEERRIVDYLKTNGKRLSKLREHFGLQ